MLLGSAVGCLITCGWATVMAWSVGLTGYLLVQFNLQINLEVIMETHVAIEAGFWLVAATWIRCGVMRYPGGVHS